MKPCHLLSIALIFLVTGFASGQEKKPNILFAFADDWGKYASAFAALDESPSPNSPMDRHKSQRRGC